MIKTVARFISRKCGIAHIEKPDVQAGRQGFLRGVLVYYPIPSTIVPVPSQRRHGSFVRVPVSLSTCLPLPSQSGQTSWPVPAVPGSGSSSEVCCLNGSFDFMADLLLSGMREISGLLSRQQPQKRHCVVFSVSNGPEPSL